MSRQHYPLVHFYEDLSREEALNDETNGIDHPDRLPMPYGTKFTLRDFEEIEHYQDLQTDWEYIARLMDHLGDSGAEVERLWEYWTGCRQYAIDFTLTSRETELDIEDVDDQYGPFDLIRVRLWFELLEAAGGFEFSQENKAILDALREYWDEFSSSSSGQDSEKP